MPTSVQSSVSHMGELPDRELLAQAKAGQVSAFREIMQRNNARLYRLARTVLRGDSFSVTLTKPGIYDYYCVPHEHAGMVGRIVVANPGAAIPTAPSGSPIEGIEADPFPPVKEIVRAGRVLRPDPS